MATSDLLKAMHIGLFIVLVAEIAEIFVGLHHLLCT